MKRGRKEETIKADVKGSAGDGQSCNDGCGQSAGGTKEQRKKGKKQAEKAQAGSGGCGCHRGGGFENRENVDSRNEEGEQPQKKKKKKNENKRQGSNVKQEELLKQPEPLAKRPVAIQQG